MPFSLDKIDIPEGLSGKIMGRIAREERKIAARRFVFGGISTVGSFGIMILSAQYALTALSQSGFVQYFSLMFSDAGVIFSLWKEFLLLLAESAPVFELAIVLSAFFVLLLSVKSVIKNMYSVSSTGILHFGI